MNRRKFIFYQNFQSMTQPQENILSMWSTVNDILNKNEPIWKKLPAFVLAVDNFRSIRSNFYPEAQKQQTLTKGVADSKAQVYIRLARVAAQMANNLQAFARRTGKSELKAISRIKPSDFERARDQEIPIMVKTLLDQAKNHLDELEPYGINEASLSTLQTLLDEYKQASASPRAAISTRKTTTANIAAYIRKGKEELEQLDLLVGNFTETDSSFVSDFRNARIIVNNTGRSAQKDDRKDQPS